MLLENATTHLTNLNNNLQLQILIRSVQQSLPSLLLKNKKKKQQQNPVCQSNTCIVNKKSKTTTIQRHPLYSKIYIYETFQNILLSQIAAYMSKFLNQLIYRFNLLLKKDAPQGNLF